MCRALLWKYRAFSREPLALPLYGRLLEYYCGYAGLFCGSTGLFCASLLPGLFAMGFWSTIGDIKKLICGSTGLFYGNLLLSLFAAGLWGTFADIQGSFVEVQGSFVEVQGSFLKAQGSFVEVQGSFVEVQGSFTGTSCSASLRRAFWRTSHCSASFTASTHFSRSAT